MKFTRSVRGFLVLAALLAVGFVVFAHPQTAAAVNPPTISFQGKIVKADGTNVADGTYSILFKLYSTTTGGTALWTETQSSVAVVAGVFQVNLGSVTTLTTVDFNANPTLYLGITFASDSAEMAPRPQLQSVPFAFNADKVGGIAAAGFVQLAPSSQQTGLVNVSGTGNFGGDLNTSTNLRTGNTIRLDNTGTLSNITGYTQLSGDATYSQGNGDQFMVQSTAVPSADMLWISNSGKPVTADGINAQQIDYYAALTSAASQASALRVNATNTSTVAGSTTDGLRVVITTSAAAGNTNGIKIDTITAGSGTASALNIGTGWTNLISSPNFSVTGAGSITSAGSFTPGTVNVTNTDPTNAATGLTYTVNTAATSYYLNSTASANNAVTSTFNITGLPAVDGTVVFITGVSAKAATGINARVRTVVFQISGTTIASIATASTQNAATVSRSFSAVRLAGVWQVVGEGPTATPTGSTVNLADFAEYITYVGQIKPQAGDVLAVGVDTESVSRSAVAYDANAIGVVSTTPYETGGADDGHSVIIALTGRVPVNVNLENGPIKIGDKLTASSTPGQAMKATKAGHIVGTALSSYDGSQPAAQVTMQLGAGYDNPGSTSSTADTGSSIVTSSLTSNGALTIDSGSIGDVSIDTGSNAGYVNLGTKQAAGVNLSQTGQTTTVAGALTIDQTATFNGAVKLNNPDKDGLLSSANFSVNGAGDVNTNGSFITKGGSLQMLDATGNTLFTIDTSGNGTFAGSLNVASASVSGGLSVGGDVSVAGLSTFQKLATFMAKTIFKQDVEFDGHITVASDSAGYATLRVKESKVHVTFANAYADAPIVNANTVDGQFVQTTVSNISSNGFDIMVTTPVLKDTKFSWTAIAVASPQTASNPLPVTAP